MNLSAGEQLWNFTRGMEYIHKGERLRCLYVGYYPEKQGLGPASVVVVFDRGLVLSADFGSHEVKIVNEPLNETPPF